MEFHCVKRRKHQVDSIQSTQVYGAGKEETSYVRLLFNASAPLNCKEQPTLSACLFITPTFSRSASSETFAAEISAITEYSDIVEQPLRRARKPKDVRNSHVR